MKVFLVLNPSRFVWPLPPLWPLACAVILGLSFAATESLAQPGIGGAFQRGRLPLPGRAEAEPEEAEEEPEKLIGLLDPALAIPLMTLEEEKDFRGKRLTSYRTSALKSPSPSNAQQELIEAGVRYRVLRMTIPENWTDMANVTGDLVKDNETFADGSTRARGILLRAAHQELEQLVFSEQPTYVKINAATLLGRLNVEKASSLARTPAIPYVDVADTLIKILEDSQQRIDVKVAAVRGLSRILADGNPLRDMRDKISRALTDQLNSVEDYVSGSGRDWYHWRLIDALGNVEFPRSMTQQTFVVDALWKTMHNEDLPWPLRTRAVRSLGQLKLDSTFNVHLLVHEIVLLTGKMAFTYNSNPNLSFWPQCFMDVYFAFKVQEAAQQQRGWGLLQNPPPGVQPVVEGAYQQVLPLVNAVIKHEKPEKVPDGLFGPTSQWLKANEPPDAKIHQNAAPLIANPATPATPDSPAGADDSSTHPTGRSVPSGV